MGFLWGQSVVAGIVIGTACPSKPMRHLADISIWHSLIVDMRKSPARKGFVGPFCHGDCRTAFVIARNPGDVAIVSIRANDGVIAAMTRFCPP
jgi:hypothetical protein